MSAKVPDQVLENILIELDEMDRVRTLTNRQLVEEYLVSESDVAVEEMMTRLWPEWAEREVGH